MLKNGGQAQQENLFFEKTVKDYVESPRFLRRGWLAAEVDARLGNPDARFVLLTADPGAGKSTFMAQLAADHPGWPRYFIRRDQRTPLGDVATNSFLLRIGYQLAALYPDLFSREQVRISVEQRVGTLEENGELVGVEVKRILASPFYEKVIQIQQHVKQEHGKVVGMRVEELMVEPQLMEAEALANLALFDPARALLKLNPKQQIVILVDALDEIHYHDTQENILKWLTNCPELPANVRFVLSSRPPDTPLKLFCDKQAGSVTPLTITAADPQLQADVQAYVVGLAGEPGVAAELVKMDPGVIGWQTRLIHKANGNLGYADALARAIDAALDRKEDAQLAALLALNDLPDDLEDLYAFFLFQIKAEVEAKGLAVPVCGPDGRKGMYLPAWPAVYQPLLAVLSVALSPLSPDQIRDFSGTGTERSYVLDALGRLRQFLTESGGQYRLYHATLAEFLTGVRTRERGETADLYADSIEWNRNIATSLWEAYHEDWSTCDDYGLDSLAAHLHRGKQFDRLAELIDPPWMRVRFTRGGNSYDGFISDLMLAWELAFQQTLQEIEEDRSMRSFAECVWYALIRTSINSLSGDYQPGLVSLAVETGYWTEERALSLTMKMADPQQRAAMMTALLNTGKLSENRRAVLEEDALKTALAIGPRDDRVKALAAVFPFLHDEMRAKAAQAGMAAVETFNDWDSQWLRGEALTDVAPLLSGDLVKAGLAVADTITDRYWRSRALAALAPLLDGMDRTRALQMGFGRAQSVDSDEKKAELLELFVPLLPADLTAAALKTARELTNPYFRARAMAVLGLSGVEKVKNQAVRVGLEALRLIKDPDQRARALAVMAPALEGDTQKAMFDEALIAGEKIKDLRLRTMVMSELIPNLDGDAREQALKKTLADVLSEEDDVERAELLSKLTPMLSGEMAQQALSAGLMPQGNMDAREMFNALIPLAPFLSGQQAEAFAGLCFSVLRDVINLPDEDPTKPLTADWMTSAVMMLVALFPVLEDPMLEKAVKTSLKLSHLITGRGSQLGGLAWVAPWLDEADWKEHIEWRIESLSPDAGSFLDPWERANTLADVGSVFQPGSKTRNHWLSIGLDIALTIESVSLRADALAALAPHLEGEIREKAVAAALDLQNEAYQAEILAALAPQLEGDQAEQVRKAAEGIQDRLSRAVILAGLAPKMSDEKALLREVRSTMAYCMSPEIQASDRSSVLLACSNSYLFKHPILDLGTINTIANYIGNFSLYWEWL